MWKQFYIIKHLSIKLEKLMIVFQVRYNLGKDQRDQLKIANFLKKLPKNDRFWHLYKNCLRM